MSMYAICVSGTDIFPHRADGEADDVMLDRLFGVV